MRHLSSLLLFLLANVFAYSQVFTGSDAENIQPGAKIIRYTSGNEIPSFLEFRPGHEIAYANFESYLRKTYRLNAGMRLITQNEETDQLGITHTRLNVYFGNAIIHSSKLIVHHKNGLVLSYQGNLYPQPQQLNQLNLTEAQALEYALQKVNANHYKWQNIEEEQYLKTETGNPAASYFPKGEICLFPADYPELTNRFYLCYAFEIYADEPLSKRKIYVQAANGEIVNEFDMLWHSDVPATANTKYSGIQEITTDSYSGSFRLREAGRGLGIRTLNMQNGTSYTSSVDFTDADNYWNNYNSQQDEVATDAHWGMEMTYDYYFFNHNRNSIDNAGFMLMGYVHYDVAYANAFWDGQRMTFGDGDGNPFSPLTALDVVGHEITHGLTSFTANLDYAYESGALNESYSDIFGSAIEYYAKPAVANWTIGEDMGSIIRSMADPNAYNDPDTYQGGSWVFGSEDNGGVHSNSGVMNHWYYLLCMGGSGTNDLGNSYQVNSISRTKADAIAYRTLVHYLTNTSDYEEARFYSILAAVDLYGNCGDEVEAVTKAWYAVGVGVNYVDDVIANFTTSYTDFCNAPAVIPFENLSVNGLSFSWNFGDGTTSSDVSPSHTYTQQGNYTVTLYTNGGSCGEDTLVIPNFISIDPLNPCIEFMSLNGSETSLYCNGILMDDGGANGYSDNSSSSFTIAPPGALAVTLNFTMFSFEDGYDYLTIYDGPNTSSPLIGEYTGALLPNGGTITATSGAVTLVQSSDVYVTGPGFELTWTCIVPNIPPTASFTASSDFSCDGIIAFKDFSTNLPNNWLWDFGDGTTSTAQNPIHSYQTSGVYSVELIVANNYGSDTLTISNIVTVDLEFQPTIPEAIGCQGDTITVEESNGAFLLWYDTQNASIPIASGSSFEINDIQTNTTLWVEGFGLDELRHTGKPDNTGGGSNFNSAYVHYLVFDVMKPVRIVSMVLYAGGAGTKSFRILDENDTEIAAFNPDVPVGESRVYLNLELPAGTNYRIECQASPNLYRNNSGVSYPYKIDNLISINYSSAGNGPTDPTSLSYYYFFYDWEVIESSCITEKIPVLASIALPVVADFTYSAEETTVEFTSTATQANSYSWDFGDGQTSTEENPVHTYPSAGVYQVVFTVSNGCYTNSFEQSITITVGIQEQESNVLTVYPNPATNTLHLDFSQLQDQEFSIYLNDAQGRIIIQKDKIRNDHQQYIIHLEDVASGIYNLQISSKEALYNEKILIQKE